MMRLELSRESRRRDRSRRPRRSNLLMHFEALEERRLLSLAMVKDINRVDAFPANITPVGSSIYFTTRAADGGTNLDVMTGATVKFLKDFNSPTGSSYGQSVANFTAVGSKLFFTANNGGSGNELWVSDGTGAGTKLVKDLNSNPLEGSYPSDLTAVGAKLFFTVRNVPGVSETDGLYAVYMSDGTAAGTVPLPPAPASSSILGGGPSPNSLSIAALGANDLAAFNGKLFAASGSKLVATDGTGAGTSVIGTFPGPSSTYPPPITRLTVVGSKLDFVAYDGTKTALYSNNGTVGGTTKLKSFIPTSANIYYAPPVLNSLTPVGTKLFFTANDATNGRALWVTDNTVLGTKLVKSINSISQYSLIDAPTAAGSKLFYTVASGTGSTGVQLWVSNGTPTGTTILKDINPTINREFSAAGPENFSAVNGVLFFANWGPTYGNQLWKSDGTVAGTAFFKVINPTANAFPGHMKVINNTLYFSSLDGTDRNTLWKSNGTTGGTVKVASFQPNANGDGFSHSSSFVTLGNTLVGSANGGVVGSELWKTNGTTAGTAIVKDILPGPLSSNPFDFTTVNLANIGSRAFFATNQPAGEQLWLTDGTTAGTKKVVNLAGSIRSTRALNGKLAFFESVTSGGTHTSQLWVSNGTAAGTTMLKSFASIGDYSFNALRILNGKLYFAASATQMGSPTLWTSNLTSAGTKQVVASPTFSHVSDLMPFNGKMYFSATDSTPGAELWSSDGTSAGTKRVVNLGATVTSLGSITSAGANLFFLGRSFNSMTGTTTALWKSNGTAAGTTPIHNFGKTFVSSYWEVGFPNGKLVFGVQAATSPAGSNVIQPWVSDGTGIGTKLLRNIAIGSSYTPPRLINGLLYFAGNEGTHGMELWRTDGTTPGTFLLEDINPGPLSSDPVPLAIVNGNGLVVANDGIHGFELLTSGNPATASATPHTLPSAPVASIFARTVTTPTVDYGSARNARPSATFGGANAKPPRNGATRGESPSLAALMELFDDAGWLSFRGRRRTHRK